DKSAEHWSADGRFLLFATQADSRMNHADIMMLTIPPQPGSKPATVIATPYNDQKAEVSPGGKFLLYVSDVSQRNEVYVENFPPAGGRWQVSTGGSASDPHWAGNGKEIFYVKEASRLMAAPVRIEGASFAPGVSKRLFDVRVRFGGRN